MAISYISSASANAATLTMPTHQLGDLFVLAVFRNASNTQPTGVAGWFPAFSAAGSGTNVLGVYLKYAASSSDTSGTWTNADHIAVAVYRCANFIIAGRIVLTVFSTTSVVYGSASGHVGNTISSRYVGIAGIRVNDSDLQTAPTGMTHRVGTVGASAGELVMHDTNGEQDGWSATTYVLTAGSSFAGKAAVVEIMDSGIAIPASGGIGAPIIGLHSPIIRGVAV